MAYRWYSATFVFLLSLSSLTAIAASSDQNSCESFKNSLPESVTRNYAIVPEDWSSPEGSQIKVFYYYNSSSNFRVAGQDIPRVPVVFFNGGPASASHLAYQILRRYEDFLPIRFIFIDQRGTGCSSPYPEVIDYPADLKRVARFTSRSIVKDAEFIRKTILGEAKRWRAFGQSYGGLIVHRYVEVAPEGLEAAYSHGFGINSDPLDFFSHRVESQYAVSQAFLERYPQDAELLQKLYELIPDDLCFGNNSYKICGRPILDGVTRVLGYYNYWPYLHSTLQSMIGPEGYLDHTFLKQFAIDMILGQDSETVSWGGHVITQVETLPGLASEGDPTGCIRVLERLEAKGLDPMNWPFNECRLLLAMGADRNSLKAAIENVIAADPLRLDSLEKSLAAHPELKMFLYAGQKDSFVPPTALQEEIRRLGQRVTYREFTQSGHEGFYTEQRILNDLLHGLNSRVLVYAVGP